LRYGSRAQLEALAELAGKEEGFDDAGLTLEARKRLRRVLEKAHKAGEATEEEVLDGVLQLGEACRWMREWDECDECFSRAKEGYARLLGEDSSKAVLAAFRVAGQLPSADDRIAEYRRLWEWAKATLPGEVVTFDIANNLACDLDEGKGEYEEAKAFHLAALAGRRSLLGQDNKDTLQSLGNLGTVLHSMEDYEGSLDYFQQALRVQEKVLGKTHPDTLATLMNVGSTYKIGLNDFTAAEEMFRLALDGYEKSLGKNHEDTKGCARNLAILLFQELEDKEKTRELVKLYPHLLDEGGGFGEYVRIFIM